LGGDDMALFSWIRDGVRHAVLLAISNLVGKANVPIGRIQ
jgi:hypothetical protein